MIVMRAGGCATSFFDLHLVVRDLRTGRQWSLGAGAVCCHEITGPCWSADSRWPVFAYGRSIVPGGIKPIAQTSCEAPIQPVGRHEGRPCINHPRVEAARGRRGLQLSGGGVRCRGIVAPEACKHGAPGGSASTRSSVAYPLKRDPRDPIVARRPLERAWEEGVLSTERHVKVLVIQDSPLTPVTPNEWVWELDGQHLGLIASYRANDAAQVIAMRRRSGWAAELPV